MLNKIKSFYNFAEETYLEFEDKLLDTTIDTYDLAKEYIQESSMEISKYLDNFFSSDDKFKTLDNPIFAQLDKIDKSIVSLDLNSNEEWESKLIYAATSIGHLNEKIVKILCTHYNTIYSSTQASKINSLKSYLSKMIINDFYFINNYRNSILHANDFDYSLINLNEITKKKLFFETKTAIAKLEFIYSKLEEIKIKKE